MVGDMHFFTLDELWEVHEGEPFRIRLAHWSKKQILTIVYKIPCGVQEYLGYTETGHGCGYPGDQELWIADGLEELEEGDFNAFT